LLLFFNDNMTERVNKLNNYFFAAILCTVIGNRKLAIINCQKIHELKWQKKNANRDYVNI